MKFLIHAQRAKNVVNILSEINSICKQAFLDATMDESLGVVCNSDRPDIADFQCNGLLTAAKKYKMTPQAAAKKVLPHLQKPDLFTVEFAHPGFLNFRVAEVALARQAEAVLDDPRALLPLTDSPLNVLVDYGGANLAKEMHVGHLRSAIVGQAIYTLFEFAGHKTTSDVHLGDWGLQIGQLICQIQDERPALLDPENNANLTIADLQTWYPRASARSKLDATFLARARTATVALQSGQDNYKALWRQIHDVSSLSLLRDYGRLGVHFDQWYGESRYQEILDGIVNNLLLEGIAEISEGAVVIHMPKECKLPPLILRNSNGGFGYGATDLATIKDRVVNDNPDLLLYVVDSRQRSHFQQVFYAAEQAGYLEKTRVEHVAFGTVNGRDGKPFKTRSGGVMRLHDLIEDMNSAALKRLDEAGSVEPELRADVAEKIAIAAITFGELIHDRESNYVFDMDKFLQFEGKTGPYVQYSCVRLRALFKKAEDAGLESCNITDLGTGGRQLVLRLLELPQVYERALAERKPSHIANQAFNLANATNAFYHANRILGSESETVTRRSHLRLLQAGMHAMSVCLDLLGIDIPKQM